MMMIFLANLYYSSLSLTLQGTSFVLHGNSETFKIGDVGQSGNHKSMSAGGLDTIGTRHYKDAITSPEIDRELSVKRSSSEVVPILPPDEYNQPHPSNRGHPSSGVPTRLGNANGPTAYQRGDHFKIREGEERRQHVPRVVDDLGESLESPKDPRPQSLSPASGPTLPGPPRVHFRPTGNQ